MSTQSEKGPSVKICKIEVRSSQPAGSPIHRASQGLLPGAPTKKGAAYLPYFERPTKPTSRGGGTYIHTDTYIPRLLTTEKQAQSGSPKMRNPTVETPTNRGERVKRCPNESRAYMYDPSVLPSFLHSFSLLPFLRLLLRPLVLGCFFGQVTTRKGGGSLFSLPACL